MDGLLARAKSTSSSRRKRSDSDSAAGSSITPSDQKPREEKSKQYLSSRYNLLLETKGSFMRSRKDDINTHIKHLSKTLLENEQVVPKDTLFHDEIFSGTCEMVDGRNEAKVVQDITRLLVPSAQALALRHDDLHSLTESVNEGWNNSFPLTGIRPQPDYSVGFKREAFSHMQHKKISPFVGDVLSGDRSLFMGTYYMYFPFLACEVKCGGAALDVADRQNAHSMTLAVRAVVELFRLTHREKEVDRTMLAFSVSHDHRSVRLYGHYPVIEGPDTTYYRHHIRTFDFTEQDGKEKWTAYTFTKNVYHNWAPGHLRRLCSAIDDLPQPEDMVLQEPAYQNSPLPSALSSVGTESSVSNLGMEPTTSHTSFADSSGSKRRAKKSKQQIP